MKKGSEAKGKAVAPRAAGGKSPEGPARSGGIDLGAVRELARIATEMNLSEVEADPSGRIRVRRRVGRRALDSRSGSTPRPPISLAPPPPVEGAPEPGTFITSPFVGTFYRAPSPEATAFVEVGDTVRKGQVVCIVEAMKLMNEIEAEADGKVAEILARNGEHVEYGQHLIRLAKG
ncbi:MAG TPA: acetyl-CoA carboxylase biotin carboxyl carrier protein [Polyangia bacterium]|jgi:acetyl-CoA carboxylase biotin carboxyl carrier protein|nr:acetyl-CoA carboxylase biotin carboxyl carrier protein [Polyangia bacterium]